MQSAVAVASLVGLVAGQLYPGLTTANHTCVIQDTTWSCPTPDAQVYDVCCTETYGGLVLSTQFWSTYTGLESQGQLLPNNSWTLHGLWPDFCNGSYTQYCDLGRQYDPSPSPKHYIAPNGTNVTVPAYNGPSVATFIKDFERYDLLDWMNTYWINQGAPNANFWAHEFSKHATCYSTFEVPCYGPKYVQHQEVIQFYETAISYYENFPTWDWLNEAGITPDNSTRITLSDVQAALTNASGALPYIGCSGPRYNETDAGKGSSDNGRTIISEAWYYQYVYGRVQDGVTQPVNATVGGSVTSCAEADNALLYPEPATGSVRQVPEDEFGSEFGGDDDADDSDDSDWSSTK